MLCYPSISIRVFQSFRCFRVDDHDYLESDFAVTCWKSGDHVFYVVIATVYLFGFVLGMPLFLLWEMWRNRQHLHDDTSSEMRIGLLLPLLQVKLLAAIHYKSHTITLTSTKHV